ncbi:hypothetical protein BVI2075_70031 [Burkholderia vietnamiensis]|nr:hypothetical protein BVI2075_70031 [Burkholderia vietnamiensis]
MRDRCATSGIPCADARRRDADLAAFLRVVKAPAIAAVAIQRRGNRLFNDSRLIEFHFASSFHRLARHAVRRPAPASRS